MFYCQWYVVQVTVLPSFTLFFSLKLIVDYTICLCFNGYLTIDVTLMFFEIAFRKEHKGLP